MMAVGIVGLTVAATSGPALASGTPTYVERGGANTYLRQPRTLPFSVDGDLVGVHLSWRHWGGSVAIAHGNVYERGGYPSYGTRTVPGTVVLDHVRACDDARYYTRARIYPARPQLFRAPATALTTPCSG